MVKNERLLTIDYVHAYYEKYCCSMLHVSIVASKAISVKSLANIRMQIQTDFDKKKLHNC